MKLKLKLTKELIFISFLAIIFVLLMANQFQLTKVSNKIELVAASGTNSKAAAKTLSEGAVKVDFYVMSQCPYGVQVENAIKPVLDALGSNINFNLNFIASDLGDGSFRSLHGQNEVAGDIVQLCAEKHYPSAFMDFVACQNNNAGAIPGNWEECSQQNNLDAEKIRACYEGEEGKQLLSESIKKSEAVGAQGSPTIYINGKSYGGQRTSEAFKSAICAEFAVKPKECGNTVESAATETPTGGCG